MTQSCVSKLANVLAGTCGTDSGPYHTGRLGRLDPKQALAHPRGNVREQEQVREMLGNDARFWRVVLSYFRQYLPTFDPVFGFESHV